VTDCGIDLDLFEVTLRDYANELAEGSATVEDAPTGASDLLVFLETYFSAFFSFSFGITITGFNSRSRSAAVAALEDAVDTTKSLAVFFVLLCDHYIDIAHAAYGGGGPAAARDLHCDYIPDLLARISSWASEQTCSSLQAKVDEIAQIYRTDVSATLCP
jgi:hypothetical protein